MIGIYRIVSPTYKIYIGQSWNIEERRNKYKNLSCRDQPAIYNSLKKHGFAQHKFEIMYQLKLGEATQQELDRLERFYIHTYKAMNYQMLNLREGGSNGKLSEEHKRKIGLKSKGRVHSEETRKKISDAHRGKISKRGNESPIFGRKLSEESKLKMSEAHIGKTKKSIIQLSKQDEPIREWNGIIDASRNLDIHNSSIIMCCKGRRRTAGGFKWKYS